MSFQLIIVKQAPYLGRLSQEITEAIMSLALFDIDHKVVFFEDGLAWLRQNQAPIAQKSVEKQLKALPMYGSEEIYYCSEHKAEQATLGDIAEPVSQAQLAQWFQDAKHIEVF